MAATKGAASYSNIADLYKKKYPNGIAWEGLKTSRFYNLVEKDTNFGEEAKLTVIQITPGLGGTSNFVAALANKGPGTTAKLTISRKPDYVIGSIDGEVMRSGKEHAIVDAVFNEITLKGKDFGILGSRRFWGENSGAMGQLAATSAISGATFTVRSATQVRNFRAGMTLKFSNGTTALRDGELEVLSVNYATNVVTCTTNVTDGIAAAANSDLVWTDGEYGNVWLGVLSYAPTSDPSASESFCGIDRTDYDLRYVSGYRPSTGSVAGDYEQTVSDGLAEVAPWGVQPPYLFCSPKTFSKWTNQIEKPNWVTVKSNVDATLGLRGIQITGPLGDLTVLPDGYCPDGNWVATDPGEWTHRSNGPYPNRVTRADLNVEQLADAWQMRMCGYSALDPNQALASTVIGSWT